MTELALHPAVSNFVHAINIIPEKQKKVDQIVIKHANKKLLQPLRTDGSKCFTV